MTKSLIIAVALVAGAAGVVGSSVAVADSRPIPKPSESAQKEADRRFKSGVALFKTGKFVEALAEFGRAYEIAPHPLVLYNLAVCHRELANHREAVALYLRFLDEGTGVVDPARLATAKAELDALYARVVRVTVKVQGADGATLVVDGEPAIALPLQRPLILASGDHTLIARAAGRADVERTLRFEPGEEREVELSFAAAAVRDPAPPAPEPVGPPPAISSRVVPPAPRSSMRLAIHAGFGTNALRVDETGVPVVGLALGLGSRIELGLDATLVAYAVMPSVRVRLAGTAVALHAIAAAPIALSGEGASDAFVAGAIGLGLRVRATPRLALRLEAYASYAGEVHATTLPTFLGGELWF